MLSVTATVKVKQDKVEEFEQAVAEARPGMLADEGCMRWDLQRVSGGSGDYVLLEEYADGEAIRRHGQSDEFVAFGARLKDLLLAEPTITVLKPVGEQARS